MLITKYDDVRDLVWEIQKKYWISELPVDVFKLCSFMGHTVMSYRKGAEILKLLRLDDRCAITDGFTTVLDGRFHIFYNDKLSRRRNRFTVAHELGHICCGHITLSTGGVTVINREINPDIHEDNPYELAANIFASRLLAPACVLWGLHIRDADTISRICDISMPAAESRKRRMDTLYKREKYWLETKGKSCFLQSPVEKLIYERFENYMYHERFNLVDIYRDEDE